MDTPKRSIAKAITWRIISVLITTAIAFAAVGDIAFAGMIGITDTLIKLFIYYFHERMWTHSRYGKAKTKKYENGVKSE